MKLLNTHVQQCFLEKIEAAQTPQNPARGGAFCGVVPGDGSVLTSTDCPAFPFTGVVLLSARRHQAPRRCDQ